MEHTLSADFATGIAALARTAAVRAGWSPLTPGRALRASRNGNPEKKGIFATPAEKKRLRKRAHVLFSAPILIARPYGAAFRKRQILEE